MGSRGISVFVLGLVAALLITETAFAAEHEFRFKKPDVQSVAVLGEFNGWKAQPMTKGSDGTWTLRVSLPSGTHGYKFLVNGTDWQLDPESSKRKTVDGVENSAVEISASSASPTASPLIGSTASATSASSLVSPRATASALTNAPAATVTLSVTPGATSTFEVPLSRQAQIDAARNGNPPIKMAKVLIGVPVGFDPQRSHPLLIISATVDYPSSSLYPRYEKEAIDAGWVIMAADAMEKPKDDHNGWRWATISAGLDAMEANWPAAKSWPIACGGFSGGAKRSGYIAGEVATKTQHKLIGMLMGGCNQDMASMALQHTPPPPIYAFQQVPIFLSSGADDKIATPDEHKGVMNSMKGSGFKKIKLESYPGAHDPYPQHTTEALAWFLSEGTSGARPRPSASAFDSFFKKK